MMKMALCKNTFALSPLGCSNASGSIKQLCLSHVHHCFPGTMSACNTDGNRVCMLHRRELCPHATDTDRNCIHMLQTQTGTTSACCTDGDCVRMLHRWESHLHAAQMGTAYACCRHRLEPRLHAAQTGTVSACCRHRCTLNPVFLVWPKLVLISRSS